MHCRSGCSLVHMSCVCIAIITERLDRGSIPGDACSGLLRIAVLSAVSIRPKESVSLTRWFSCFFQSEERDGGCQPASLKIKCKAMAP